jgi:hypothetical protein
MTIGTSLFLIAVGAILKFAVHWHIGAVDLHVAGIVLMAVGGLGLALGLLLLWRGRPTDVPPARI